MKDTVNPAISQPPDFDRSGYTMIDRVGGHTVWLGRDTHDSAWDAFLQRVAGGHFQQSSSWSRVKRLEGWQAIRVIIEQHGRIAGGFQLLHQRLKSLVSVGYVIKGPVRCHEALNDDSLLLDILCRIVRRQGLWAVIVQLPDTAGADPAALPPAFLPNRLIGIIEANLVVDLTASADDMLSGFRKSTRYGINRAQREGVRIVEGGEEDIPAFFELMCTTCRMQQTAPNPPRAELLHELWSAFFPQGCLRLTLAKVENEIVAAQIAVAFGSAVCIWKRGWAYTHPRKQPNHLLTYETLLWARERGYRTCDFAAFDRTNAELLLHGASTRIAENTRDFFHLGFGGTPVLLPRAAAYIPNPLFRLCYRLALCTARCTAGTHPEHPSPR